MHVGKKLDYALQHVRMIGGHVEEESSVRLAALSKIREACDAEAGRIAAEIEERIKALG